MTGGSSQVDSSEGNGIDAAKCMKFSVGPGLFWSNQGRTFSRFL